MAGESVAKPKSMSPLREPKVTVDLLVGSAAVNLLALGMPLVILQVYDRVVPNLARETLLALIMGLAVVLLVDTILKIVRSHVLAWQAAAFAHTTSVDAAQRLVHARGVVDKTPPWAHVNRFNAVTAIADYHAGPARLLVIDLPFVAIFVSIMALVGGALVMVPVLLFGFFLFLASRRRRETRKLVEERTQLDNRKYDFVIEALTGIRTIKALAVEPVMQRRLERLQTAVASVNYRSIRHAQDAQAAASLHGNLSQIAVVGFGALMVIEGTLSIGALACCTLLSGQILQPLLKILTIWSELEAIETKREDASALLALPAPRVGAHSVDRIAAPDIRIEDLHYVRPDGASIFRGASVKVPAGAVAAFVGSDGAGRSTLMRLVRGDILPNSGHVLVGGVDTASAQFAALRPALGYVPQDPVTFNGTIWENLTLSSGADQRHAAVRAAGLVGLADRVKLLPAGYDTRIDEGMGQTIPIALAQQIVLARAVARSYGLLILDEVNAVLDERGETALAEALAALRGQTTVLMVTHRPSLIARADIVFDVGDGVVVRRTPQPAPREDAVA